MPQRKPAAPKDDSVSLNKYISDSGFCSRREADTYIETERVTINGRTAHKGNRVQPGDDVQIDGEPFGKKVKTCYLAFHKPAGVTTTTDTRDRTNIISYINHPQRIFPIGRLDKESEGLIFLTNDGNIVNKILRAGNRHEKEYMVWVDKPIEPEFVERMAAGVRIGGVKTLPCRVVQEGKSIFRITLVQGLNRQIRRMCEALEYKVTRLQRVRIMSIPLGKLPAGQWRYFTPQELEQLQEQIRESSNDREASEVKPAKAERSAKSGERKTGSKARSVKGSENEERGNRTGAKGVEKPARKGAEGKRGAKEAPAGKSSFKDFRKAGKKGK